MNGELKKILSKVKTAQSQLQSMLKDKTWVEEARKYAEKQGREVKKLLDTDVAKVKTFIERERKELEKLLRRVNKATPSKKKSASSRKKSAGGASAQA
jgi:SPX domain protein involved in polyphosphate accumulation